VAERAEDWFQAVREILDKSHLWQPEQLASTVGAALARLGLRATIYQVDPEQRTLRPLPHPDRPDPDPIGVDTSAAGRAFALVESVSEDSPPDRRWWVPMVNGTDRLGVVEFVRSAGPAVDDDPLQRRCEMVAGLVGHLLTTTAPRGDHLHRARRSAAMTVGAELLWQVLPPLTVSIEELVVSAVLEPCYDVGGDGFDYILDGRRPQVMVLDAAGRGLRAGLACAVVLAAVRATRRAGGDLLAQAGVADSALLEQFPDARFATAVLAELDLDSGTLRYVNAGHPPPLLFRDGKFVRPLTDGRRLPLGIEGAPASYGVEALRPGDRLLLHTDGVTEARDSAGEQFGAERLIALTESNPGLTLPVPETLRRLSHTIIDHQHGPPVDDATLMLMEWSPAASRRTMPAASRQASAEDMNAS
jgi:sigma-B regulation protein RsbU (phosphoserine phosphatase)